MNLEARQGRAEVAVEGPRFSGLHGESLSTAVRWERDVVRLERAVLQQRNSRCRCRTHASDSTKRHREASQPSACSVLVVLQTVREHVNM